MGSVSEEAISCIRTVKAFATEKFESERFKIFNERTYNLGVKQAMWNGCQYALWNLILNSAMAAIIYFGAVMVNNGNMTVGSLSSFLLYMIFLIF
jgi:ABC-type multidrug transport system fused ATPase/permease subunit